MKVPKVLPLEKNNIPFKDEEKYNKIRNKALNLLSFRIRSKKEVLDRLEKYIKSTEIEDLDEISEIKSKILDELESLNLINDSLFAQKYLEEKINSLKKPLGPIAIKQFLQKKGISKEIIDSYLSSYNRENMYSSALRLGQKKAAVWSKLDKRIAKKKLSDFLYRKGFTWDTIYAVVDTIFKVK